MFLVYINYPWERQGPK